MKKALTNTVLIVAGAGLPYLCGAFGNATFDITEWEPVSRGMIGIFMMGATAAAICVALGIGVDNTNKQ
jgi:hypothetical protein